MKKILIFMVTILFLTGCATTSKEEFPITETKFMLNTVASISIYSLEDKENPHDILDGCFRLCSEYENMLSRTIEGSDIDRINKSNGQPIKVSQETADLISTSLKYSKLSEGLFDISVAPISTLWNFQSENPSIPNNTILKEAVTHVDYNNIIINGNLVTLNDPSAAIDLGGIAKGYIADKAAEYLKKHNVTSAIISLGGNILTVGANPNGSDFSIGIQKPFDNQNETLAAVYIRDKSVVTSGIYERYFKVDNIIYHHILDPKTGYPVKNNLLSTTIISDKSIDGDALSTTCFAMGLEKGMALIESIDGVEAVFITEGNEIYKSSGIGTNVKFKLIQTEE